MESLAVFSGLSFCPGFRFWGRASSCLPVSWAIPSPYLTVPTGRHWCFWEGKSDTEEPEGSSCAPRAPPPWVSLQHRGDLGNVHADADGRAIFRLEDKQLKVGWKRKWEPFLRDPLSKAVVSPQRYGMSLAEAWSSMREKTTWAGVAIPYPRSQGTQERGG